MNNNLKDMKNIYIDEIKTKEDALKLIEKGMFYKQNRIEEVFNEKFIKLRKKIHKILENKIFDELEEDIYFNSILVDCRAMFLENKRFKFNSTLQNSYRARGLEEYANGIDELFDEKITDNKTLKEIIKDWVDKRVVHYDYLDEDEENLIHENVSSILDRKMLENLLTSILLIANQYEEIKKYYGKNTEEQINKVMLALTS